MVVSCNINFDTFLPCPLRNCSPPLAPASASFCHLFSHFVFFFFLFAPVGSWLHIDPAIVLYCHSLYVCKMEYVEIEKEMGQSSFAGMMHMVFSH
jgi:hypothetical protein